VAVDSALDVEEAQDNYFRNHVSPLISFPPALIFNVLAFALTATELTPDSELALLSIILSGACFYSYFHTFDKTSFYIFGLHVIASFLEGCQRLSMVYGLKSNWTILIASYNDLELNLSLSVILRFLAFGLLVTIPLQTRHIWVVTCWGWHHHSFLLNTSNVVIVHFCSFKMAYISSSTESCWSYHHDSISSGIF